MGSIIRESAKLAGHEGYRGPSVWRDLGIITSREPPGDSVLSTFKLPPLSATSRGLFYYLLFIPSANIHYLPQYRQGRGSSVSSTHACHFISPDGWGLERFGASVPHVHCIAWIQQSSCSKALLPQRCFSAIKEYSSPSCPPTCTAILAQFGSLFSPSHSLPFSILSIVSHWYHKQVPLWG